VKLGVLYAQLDPVADRVTYAPKEEQGEFRSKLDDFCRLYAFLAQILPFAETDWEKRFHFYRLLLRRLPVEGSHLPVDLRDKVAIDFYRTRETFDGAIELERGDSELAPIGRGGPGWGEGEEEKDPLSVIIDELNQIFGIKTNGDMEAAITHLRGKLQGDVALEKGAEVNPPETFRLLFDQTADKHFAEMVDAFYRFYVEVSNDAKAKERFFDWLFDQYQRGDQE